jgi:hypothetical protein
MTNKIAFTVVFMVVVGSASSAQTASTPTAAPAPANSAEMKQIFLQDQLDRGNNPFAKSGEPEPKPLPGLEIRKNDDARDARVKELLRQGLLHTGIDYYRAALVFQHSGNAEDTLLAHILSEVALSKGESSALWLSAATLDRYLVQINQKQVFGTQYKSVERSDETKPYLFIPNDIEPTILSDPLRAEFCVKPFVIQENAIPGSGVNSGLIPCSASAEMQRKTNQATSFK